MHPCGRFVSNSILTFSYGSSTLITSKVEFGEAGSSVCVISWASSFVSPSAPSRIIFRFSPPLQLHLRKIQKLIKNIFYNFKKQKLNRQKPELSRVTRPNFRFDENRLIVTGVDFLRSDWRNLPHFDCFSRNFIISFNLLLWFFIKNVNSG